jgi:hypothetical protein
MRGIESAECIAAREAARIEDCREVAWGSKSFSPRLGILGRSVPLNLATLVGEIEQQRKSSYERLLRKRKSCVSSLRSMFPAFVLGS